MSRIGEAVCPARLGKGFRFLLTAAWISNVGDGISLAAGPLLVASETRSPALVASAALLQRLPWLLFGLQAGLIADRLNRRLVVVTVDLVRAGVLAMLSFAIFAGSVNVAIVLVAMFLLGAAEVFSDVTTSTLMPMLVAPEDLGIANARLMFGLVTANQLAGPPIGAALFALSRAVPFASQAVFVAFGAILVSRIVVPIGHVPTRAPGRQQIAEGMRWLWAHAPVRTLTITIVSFNVTFGAAWSVLVLYSNERLGLGDIGFGVLTAMSAVGGVVGSWSYRRIEQRVSLADIMRVGLIIETLTHLTLAITTLPAVAMTTLFVFGIHATVWNTTATSVRQRAVPIEFQGRVGSVYMMGVHGGIVVGAAVGGLIASRWGVTGPFWFAFVGSAVILVALWRQLGNIAHADQQA